MLQFEAVDDWKDEGRVEGRVEGQATSVIDLLEIQFGTVPGATADAIRANTDGGKFKQWLAAAVRAATFDEFRAATQLP